MQLHKTLGVNPRMTFCPRCGGNGPEIVLLGSRDNVITCKNCGTLNFGSSSYEKCGKCETPLYNGEVRKIRGSEKVPGGLCDACKTEIKEWEEIVRAGGVFFRCDCGAEGVVKSDSEMAKAVREHSKIFAPKPVGLSIAKCPNCSPKKEGA